MLDCKQIKRMAKQQMHPHSMEAKDLPMKYTQQKEILHSIRMQSATRQELSERLDLPINSICGRVRELIDQGVVYEEGHVIHFDQKGRRSRRAILFAK